MERFKKAIRQHIGEIYDGSSWESVTGIYNNGVDAFQIWKFEKDVEFENETWRCVIISKHNMEPDDLECIYSSEDIFENYEQIG